MAKRPVPKFVLSPSPSSSELTLAPANPSATLTPSQALALASPRISQVEAQGRVYKRTIQRTAEDLTAQYESKITAASAQIVSLNLALAASRKDLLTALTSLLSDAVTSAAAPFLAILTNANLASRPPRPETLDDSDLDRLLSAPTTPLSLTYTIECADRPAAPITSNYNRSPNNSFTFPLSLAVPPSLTSAHLDLAARTATQVTALNAAITSARNNIATIATTLRRRLEDITDATDQAVAAGSAENLAAVSDEAAAFASSFVASLNLTDTAGADPTTSGAANPTT